MELGLFTMPLHPPGSNPAQTMDDDLEQLVTLDRLGYKEAWIGEHFTAEWENVPAPDLLIAKALGMTENIAFGTGVTCMPNHNPFMIAHRIAALDHLAHGRFYWGVGSGGFPGDFEVFGFDPKTGEHKDMTRAAIDTVVKIWEDPKPGLYETKWWSFTIPEPIPEVGLRFHLSPYQKPYPPIGVAGVSVKSDTLTLAGERGWIPMSINLVPPWILKTHWDAVEEGAAITGRTPDRSKWRIAREIYVADTTEEARRDAVEGVLARDFSDYFLRMLPMVKLMDLFKIDKSMPDSDVTIDYLADNIWIVGSPDEVAAKLRAIHEEVGGFGVLLAMGHEWKPRDKWLRSMTLLKNEVMPKLADLS